MAKQGFSYYKAETDRFQDIKIKRLKKKYRCTGYAVYQYILNEIYRVRGYMLRVTEDELFDVSEYWGVPEEEVKAIICYCAEIGLFNAEIWQEQSILTARSIQSRYLDICKVCKKSPLIEKELCLVPTEQAPPAPIQMPQLFTEDGRAPMSILQKPTTEIVGLEAKAKEELQSTETVSVLEGFAKLPETSGNTPEESNKSIKSYTSKTKPSSNSPHEEAESASRQENERLQLLLQSMSVNPDDARWLCMIEGISKPDSPLWQFAEEVRQSKGKLTVIGYMIPSIRSLVAVGRLKLRQVQTDNTGEIRRMLAAVKVASYDIEKIIKQGHGQEKVLREAIDEVRRSKGKITMPALYILKQLRKAMPAKAS